MVPVLAGIDVVSRVAVALTCRVPVVQVRGYRGEADPEVPRGKLVFESHQYGLTVLCANGGSGTHSPVTPHARIGHARVESMKDFLDFDVVKDLRCELSVSLVVARNWWRIQCRNRLRSGHDRERLSEELDFRTLGNHECWRI